MGTGYGIQSSTNLATPSEWNYCGKKQINEPIMHNNVTSSGIKRSGGPENIFCCWNWGTAPIKFPTILYFVRSSQMAMNCVIAYKNIFQTNHPHPRLSNNRVCNESLLGGIFQYPVHAKTCFPWKRRKGIFFKKLLQIETINCQKISSKCRI